MLSFLLTLAVPLTQTTPAAFQRTYAAEEAVKYKVTMAMPAMTMKQGGDVEVKFKMSTEGAVTGSLKTSNYSVEGGKGEPPEPMSFKVGANNMFEEMTMKGNNTFYFFIFVAGLTSDKAPELNKEFTIDWKNKLTGPNNPTVKGTGKVIKIDEAAKTVVVNWNLEMAVQGQTMGDFKLESTYSTPNYILKSSKGKFITRGIVAEFDISVTKIE